MARPRENLAVMIPFSIEISAAVRGVSSFFLASKITITKREFSPTYQGSTPRKFKSGWSEMKVREA